MSSRFPLYVMSVVLFTSFFSCADMVPTKEMHFIDSLNGKAYFYRYRNLDSSYEYATRAYRQVNLYKLGKAEAANNLGFCAFMDMDFDRAEALHKEVYRLTKNELELLIADVGLMKICQRRAMNKEFYDYRNSALQRMKRIREESDSSVDHHESLRRNYAFTEFYIVSAIYYYYLQQREEAIAALNEISADEVSADTAQSLYYRYIRGAASLIEENRTGYRQLREFDQLYLTWLMAVQNGYLYFEGNSLQGLADMMISSDRFAFFKQRRSHVLEQFGFSVDTLLPMRLAQQALEKSCEFNAPYQIVGTYVTIGKFLNAHECYSDALDTLTKALDCVNQYHMLYYAENAESYLYPYVEKDTICTDISWITQDQAKTVPEWISQIREQLSVAYAGLDMKNASDYNRNIYLDLLNFTRQDKELESRYLALATESHQTTLVLLFVAVGIVLVMILLWFFNKRSKVRNRLDVERLQQILSLCRDITSSIPMDLYRIQQGIDRLFGEGRLVLKISEDKAGKVTFIPLHRLGRDEKALVQVLEPYVEWAADNEQIMSALSDERIQLEKQRYIYEQHIAENKRQNLVKKACLAVVNDINPYIDRILNEVHKLIEKGYIRDEKIKKEKYQYIDELVTTINEYNDILSLWIKMKQGSLNLNIETFSLNELFDLLGKGRHAFEMKKQKLEIKPTSAMVKADKALTLFMINTLAENARKYTSEGGTVKIYAHTAETYVEISVEDDGRGLSTKDVALIVGEKVYDSHAIGMKEASDPEKLKESKGSGFGLMNCKGIIEKYKKTNDLFRVCSFNVESELGKGSRFYFRLPLGIRSTISAFLCLLLSLGVGSCRNEQVSSVLSDDVTQVMIDSEYRDLLDIASDYANDAYYANIDGEYEVALQYVDSAILLLNEHYEKYSQVDKPHRYMKLSDEGIPAEIDWWNEDFDSDYHVILDIRNEAAVAFLALKQLDEYSYNNLAFTDLYKLQSEDQTLDEYCWQLERSNTNKIVGIILCVVLLLAALITYYFLYMKKRLQNRLNLEQVFVINRKVFAASLSRIQGQENVEMLQREENVLKEIPQRIVNESFNAVNELLMIDSMGLAVYNEMNHRLEYVSCPGHDMPEMVQRCFTSRRNIVEQHFQAAPLIAEVSGEQCCVGVLYIERRVEAERETDYLLFELVARYVAIVVFNAVVKLATKYQDIETAHEEARRASWEDSLLHVQNMVLDNCLSTIKHETVYYPNKIKQIINKLNTQFLSAEEERKEVDAITELIEYYKGIFTILNLCALRQLEEVTFKRSSVSVHELFDIAEKYFRKCLKNCSEKIDLEVEYMDAEVTGDAIQLRFLLENLIDESLTSRANGVIRLRACEDGEYIRFFFTDTRREKSMEELSQLFYPDLTRMTMLSEKERLHGTEYLVCKQIIREHDEFAGHRGCRINAEPAEGGGFTIYFTIPHR